MRRVVITGIGAVSPNGIGREQFWEATRNGVSGVRRITRFDPSGYQVQVAGEVPDEFDEKLYVEVKDRPHVSRAVPLAVASVAEAVADAGLDVEAMSRDELRGIGVIVGSGGGSQDFTEEQYRKWYGANGAIAALTIPTSTITPWPAKFQCTSVCAGCYISCRRAARSTDAIGYRWLIGSGMLDTVVVGGVDAPLARSFSAASC
jgi:3-oxoacyl-[acyl-carrier-protein] synthase II